MKIYTRTGDDGTTALFSGERVPKDHPRVKAYGAVDELNSELGSARSLGPQPAVNETLLKLQALLFKVGADLATPHGSRTVPRVDSADIDWLEADIDSMDADLPRLTSFILPGGTPTAARIHVARTICRRTERDARAITVGYEELGLVGVFLNRLSDHLFVLARWENFLAGHQEVPWLP